jgi:hypothetical protein
MHEWTFADAQERFEELLDAALISPQEIVRGTERFIVVSRDEWQRRIDARELADEALQGNPGRR